LTNNHGICGIFVPRSGTVTYTVSKAGYERAQGNQDVSLMNHDVDITMVADNAPPTVSDGTITISNTTETGTTLTWNKASDLVSADADLQYIIYMSEGDNLNTVEDIEANGTVVQDYTADIETLDITGLQPGITYYFNVIVMDEGGNKTAYTAAAASTKTYPNSSGNSNRDDDDRNERSTTAAPTYKAGISGVGSTGTILPINVNTNMGSVTTDLGNVTGNIFSGTGTAAVTIPSIPGVSSYTLKMPAAVISGSQGEGALTFSTGAGSITIPDNMLAELPGTDGKKAGITIGQGDKSILSDELKTAIGDRPLVQLTLTLDGVQTQWNNPNAPVTVSIPYTPTAAELADPDYIVVWYIDGSGNVVSVPNGYYDAATGTVTFRTTHFSDYAVVYNKVSFKDVAPDAWYKEAVGYIAARKITGGTGNGKYSPEAKLTRGDFLVLLMNAYAIAPDNSPADNFSDAGSTYYTGYLASAKRLGISAGLGNNMFAPDKHIIRQEMFTLMYNALKAINQLPRGTKLPDGNLGKTISDYDDAGQIDLWAKEAMKLFVETGIIGGNSGKLMPTEMTTRAEMAQVLYNLMSKH
jgi:hypothetical protein